jgi:uncharacterized repeat protein (TIGR04052 family)
MRTPSVAPMARWAALAACSTCCLLPAACSSDNATSNPGMDSGAGGGSGATGGKSGSGGSGATGGKSGSGGGASGGATGTGGGSGSGGGSVDGGPEAVSIQFKAVVGDKPFACESTYTGLGTNGSDLVPLDFRFYVHDVRLLGNGGAETPVALDSDGKWQNGEVALLDFENGKGTCTNGTSDTNALVKGTVAPGTYTGIALRIGVPEELNHRNPATESSPLNLSALQWDWTYGRKFMKIDFGLPTAMGDGGMGMDGGMHMGKDAGIGMDSGMGMGKDGGMGMHMDGNTVFFHLGSTVCTGSAAEAGVQCQNANRPELRLEAFDASTQEIVVDYAAIAAAIAPGHDLGGTPGCMSGSDDPECASMFSAIGLDLATGAPKAGQTAFHVAGQ